MVKQTIEKVLDTYLAERILSLFREQGITIISILNALFMTFSTIVPAITDVFGEEGPAASGSPKDEEILTKWLNSLADALKRLAGRPAEPLPAIVGSVVGAF